MLDMSVRMRSAEQLMIGAIILFAAAVAPSAGPALLIASLAGAGSFAALLHEVERRPQPEFRMAYAVLVGGLVLAGGIIASEGARILLLPLLIAPTLIAACVWPVRGIVFATIWSVVLMSGVAFAVAPHLVIVQPPHLLDPIALLIACVLMASAARGADVASRAAASVDRLTGLLNRAALFPRAAELAHQSTLAGEPAAILLSDLDHFKQVNDEHGHAIGDAVLAGAAQRLRETLGNLGTIYRFGGEEFVALLPGVSTQPAQRIAEQLRSALASRPIADQEITISLGVAASEPDRPFDFEELFGAADAALYEAKRAGRNRVLCAKAPLAPTQIVTAARGERRRAGQAAPNGEPALPPRGSQGARQGASLPALHKPLAAVSAQGAGGGDERPALGARVIDQRIKRERAVIGSWLARDEAERAHMLDLIERIKAVRLLAYGVILIALLFAGPFHYGWLPFLPPMVSAAFMGAMIEHAKRRPKPEITIAGAVLVSQVGNAAGFLLALQHPYFALSLLVALIFAWAPMFPARAVAAASVLESGLIVAAAYYLGGSGAFSDPFVLGVPLVMLVAVAVLGAALGRSSVDHRSTSVVDSLTGMLNRQALDVRVTALANEAAYVRGALAMIVIDIDHFKQINDRFGHERGDAVLREVAYRIRKALRAFDAAYRIGGEEFVVLLDHASEQQACEVAERLRQAVGATPVDGLAVTISCGVAAASTEDPFDYDLLFSRADRSLYEAKQGGRNRVCVADALSARDRGAERVQPLRSAA
jgi:diguanylate cyclase (GGDEF)-like protein